MKNKIKLLLKFVGVFVLCFIVIYLIMFFWGWRLIETGNPILIEVVFAAILSIFLCAFGEAVSALEKRVKALEERLKELENKQ